MPHLWFKKAIQRDALFLDLGGSAESPNLIIPLVGGSVPDQVELRFMVETILGRRGLSDKEIDMFLEEAEKQFAYRCKVREVEKEIRARIKEQAEFSKLKFGGLKPPRKKVL